MNYGTRAKCLSIFNDVFTQPIGEYVLNTFPSYQNFAAEIGSFEEIKTNLLNYRYPTISDWKNDINSLLGQLSRFCDTKHAYAVQTVAQILDDACRIDYEANEDKAAEMLREVIENSIPNSIEDFTVDEPFIDDPNLSENPPTPIVEPHFDADAIDALQNRISMIRDTKHLKNLGELISSSSLDEKITSMKGAITVNIEALSPYTLQLIQNYVDNLNEKKIKKEEPPSE